MNKLSAGFYRWLKNNVFIKWSKEWPSRQARIWSNNELKKFSNIFTGKIINVSAWKDEDKQGQHYKDYFTNAKSYEISNYSGWRGSLDGLSGYDIDLEKALHPDLEQAFDTVFNHTTLEHIFDLHCAFENLCRLSRNVLIVVVPWEQKLHGAKNGDFWRLSPYTMRKLFAKHGFSVLYESASVKLNTKVIYLFYIASKQPDLWKDAFKQFASSDIIPLLEESF